MTIDQLLSGVKGSQPKVLAEVKRRLAVKICRYGSLQNYLHGLDVEILAAPESLHKQGLLAKHQMAEWNIKALVKEGNTGCKQCACCLQFSRFHRCLISQLKATGVYEDEC